MSERWGMRAWPWCLNVGEEGVGRRGLTNSSYYCQLLCFARWFVCLLKNIWTASLCKMWLHLYITLRETHSHLRGCKISHRLVRTQNSSWSNSLSRLLYPAILFYNACIIAVFAFFCQHWSHFCKTLHTVNITNMHPLTLKVSLFNQNTGSNCHSQASVATHNTPT